MPPRPGLLVAIALAVAWSVVAGAAACAHDDEKRSPPREPPAASTTPGAPSPEPHALPPTSPRGSDVSTLPARYPHASWVPIEAPLLSMQLLARVSVNGREAIATLDTGAMSTLMSVPVAMKLGVLQEHTPAGQEVRALDAHGDVIRGERLQLGELAIGEHRWRDVEVLVLGAHPDLFLVGADLLKDVDLYVAADEGLVGLFERGQAPKDDDDVVIPLEHGERQLRVGASAPSATGDEVRFPLIVDTGATGTTVPALVGINGGLPADLAYASTTLAVGGEQENRGRFVLAPLSLAGQEVGRVLAMSSTMEGGEGSGLLGNDVLMRFHSILRFGDAELRLRRPPARPSFRERGPGGVRCTTPAGEVRPCITARLRPPTGEPLPGDGLPGLCLEIDVAPAYAGQTLELAFTAERPIPEQNVAERDSSARDTSGGERAALFNGGAIRAYLTVGEQGVKRCFSLWRQLERLGVDEETRLSLRWVRTEGVRWPCDPAKTECLSFTGPLAKLPVR